MVRVLIYIAGGFEVESKPRVETTRDSGVTERVQFRTGSDYKSLYSGKFSCSLVRFQMTTNSKRFVLIKARQIRGDHHLDWSCKPYPEAANSPHHSFTPDKLH